MYLILIILGPTFGLRLRRLQTERVGFVHVLEPEAFESRSEWLLPPAQSIYPDSASVDRVIPSSTSRRSPKVCDQFYLDDRGEKYDDGQARNHKGTQVSESESLY